MCKSFGPSQKVLREDPTSIEALIISGLSLIGMERPESAQRHLERAYEMDPNRADLHWLWVHYLVHKAVTPI